MTTKRINYDGEEVEHKDLTGQECLKQWVKYSNKYNCKTTVIVEVGEVVMCIDFSKQEVKELLTRDKPMKYRNCETSTHFRLAISGSKWNKGRLSIIGSTFQDFEKTKENNWGESIEWVGCDYCNPSQRCACPECGQQPVTKGAY